MTHAGHGLRLRLALVLAVPLLAMPRLAPAQDVGRLIGVVEHATRGTPLAGVAVISRPLDGPARTRVPQTITGRYGTFQIDLSPGRYQLTLSTLGFSEVIDTVQVAANVETVFYGKLAPTSINLEELVAPGMGRFLSRRGPEVGIPLTRHRDDET